MGFNYKKNNNNEDIENTYSINDQLLLEMILLANRGETIKYSFPGKMEKAFNKKRNRKRI